jgi:hypothetical protein
MGYYVTLTEADFGIPETPEVLAALHEMETKFDAIKRGGSFGPDGKQDKWFSWMPNITTFDTVQAVFEALGFEVSVDEGKFWLQGYDSKTGQEDLFLAVVAPFVEEGSFTNWRGEDGALYRFEVVHGGRLVTQSANVVWSSRQPYHYDHYDYFRTPSGDFISYAVRVDPYSEESAEAVVEKAKQKGLKV